MKITKGKLIVASFILLLALLTTASVFAKPVSETIEMFLCRKVDIAQTEGGWLAVTCYKDDTAPAPTATTAPTPVVTEPPAPTPTEPPTPVVTEPPTPVPTDTGVPGEPYANAPLCAEHDPNAYHSLWNSALGCHYDHEHGDNPHEVDDVLGTQIYDDMGGEISYPWSTPHENEHPKHEQYKWFVGHNLGCNSANTGGCITDYRALAHMDGHNVVSNYHSYVIEARVCREANPNDCGIMRIGGWQFTGDIFIDDDLVYDRDERALAPLAPRPVFLYFDNVGDEQFSAWYPVSPMGWARVATEFGDLWGHFAHVNSPVSDPANLEFVPHCFDQATGAPNPGCVNNNTRRKPTIIGLNIAPAQLRMMGLPTDSTHATFEGYVDRYGNVVTGCTSVSLDCVPLKVDNVPVVFTDGGYQFNGPYKDYDIYFNGQPSGWVRFPN